MKYPMLSNKVAARALLPMAALVGAGLLVDMAYTDASAHESAASPAGAAQEPADLAALMATATPELGQRRALICKSCHTFEKGGRNGVGPNLWGVVGRPVASVEGFSYSGPLKELGGAWTYERLDAFIENSKSYVPGTAMAQRIPQADRRAAILVYLGALADEPSAAPESEAPADAAEPQDNAAPQSAAPAPAEDAPSLDAEAALYLEGLAPVAEPAGLDPEIVDLGKRLYHDVRLSGDGTVSCATCHSLATGGVDGLPVSTGIKNNQGPINAPTVFNSSHNFVQFWDGRAASLEEQAAGPVENPLEMGAVWEKVIVELARDEALVAEYQEIFGEAPSKENTTRAIADFERTLDTPNAPFDRYLKGDKGAISDSAKRGFIAFNETGCASCHTGSFFGGEAYQTVSASYFKARGGEIVEADRGRINVTGAEGDLHAFKTPILRNVAVTPPYFHDGSVKTLDEAVRLMARHQLGAEMPDADVADVVAFLKSLTGEYKGVPLDQMSSADAAPSEG